MNPTLSHRPSAGDDLVRSAVGQPLLAQLRADETVTVVDKLLTVLRRAAEG